MSRALKDLKDEIRQQIWAGGSEAENLISQHDLLFIEALGEIQKDVPSEADDNCDVVEFCRTFHRCGLTILPAPPGIIRRVFTIHKKDGKYNWCRPVFYEQCDYNTVEVWAKHLRTHALRDAESLLPALPLGFQAADSSTDSDYGRAHSGIYAIHNKNIFIAPWIQSDEAVVIEWSGIKPTTRWSDDDLVSDSPEFKKAVKLFVQYAHERDYGADVELRSSMHENYRDALSELMLQRREEARIREHDPVLKSRHCHGHLESLLSVLGVSTIPDHKTEKDWVFAHIGNNGVNNSDSDDVAAVIITLDPDAVLSTGGNKSNFIPAGSLYQDQSTPGGGYTTTQYYLDGLIVGKRYSVSFGGNEVEADNGDQVFYGSSQFIATDTIIYFIGNVAGNPVTASLVVSNYDEAIGRNFSDLIFPYSGAYGAGAEKNKFWPTIDDADWVDALSAFKLFFSDLPNNGRYYDKCYGPIHFFFLDSSGGEPDGYIANSIQGEWLRIKLIMSTSKWKVVVQSGPPYSSDSANEKTNARWPYKAWGANLVISGGAKNYERFSVDDFPYIVNGLGGSGKDTAVTQTAGSEEVYFDKFGYGKITANKDTLTYEFISVDGDVVDTLTL